MKRILKWVILLPSSLIFIVYAVLAAFLWFGDHFSEQSNSQAEALYARVKQTHEITLIDDGLSSLSKRIELIESAQKTIELEFFIYELDLASRIITQKIIEAAKRGVDVKLLVDFSAPVFKLKPAYASLLSERKIQVRYYNTVNSLRFVSVQHRSHRKLLIVDGQYAITGGRNIGNDYFNLSTHYNFLDSDVLIYGPIVKDIEKSFLVYWSSDYSEEPELTQTTEPNEDINIFVTNDSELTSAFTDILKQKEDLEKSNFKTTCNDVSFVTDYPGIMTSNRQVFKRLSEFLSEAKTEVVGESPYFVLRPDGLELLRHISDNGVKQTILTNSLRSTDAFYTVSAMTPSLSAISEAKVNLYVYGGESLQPSFHLSQGSSKRWGTHAKRAVVDGKHILIGTYNVDPRSANLNSELLFICRDNPELAAQMKKSIERRLAQSRPLFQDGSNSYLSLIKDSSLDQKIMYVFSLPLANMFNFLL